MSRSAPQKPAEPAPEAPAVVVFVSDFPRIVYPTAPGGPVQFGGDGELATSDPDLIAFLDERDTCRRAE